MTIDINEDEYSTLFLVLSRHKKELDRNIEAAEREGFGEQDPVVVGRIQSDVIQGFLARLYNAKMNLIDREKVLQELSEETENIGGYEIGEDQSEDE